MSMNATDSVRSACATFRATVDFPEPDPPAMPMISGFIVSRRPGSFASYSRVLYTNCEGGGRHNLVSNRGRRLALEMRLLILARASLFPLAATLACGRSVVLQTGGSTLDLVVAATTDIHGRARGWDYYTNAADTTRGLARVGTIIDSLRRAAVAPVVVDAGDIIQGNPLAYVAARVDTTMPHPVIAAMNAIQYDAAAIGNHEFNYGLPTLQRAIREAEFPLLAANAYTPSGQ